MVLLNLFPRATTGRVNLSAADHVELGILEREITRVARGRAVVVPLSPETHGHGTHTYAAVWKQYLAELLAASAR